MSDREEPGVTYIGTEEARALVFKKSFEEVVITEEMGRLWQLIVIYGKVLRRGLEGKYDSVEANESAAGLLSVINDSFTAISETTECRLELVKWRKWESDIMSAAECDVSPFTQLMEGAAEVRAKV